MPAAWVLHLDLDAFFATAEVLRQPALRGRPVIVGGQPGSRGVVASASYEARRYGVRSAMPVAQALRRCPRAVPRGRPLSPDFAYYQTLSRRFRTLGPEGAPAASPLVEQASIDEAYLAVPDAPDPADDGPALTLARWIKERLREDVGLTCSVGVAPNKTLAKIASDWRKPDGLVVVRADEAAAFLAPLSTALLPGIGPKTQERLAALGLRTIGDLARASPALLRIAVGGRVAADLARRARGLDDRPIEPCPEGSRPARSLGHERTFPADIGNPGELRQVINGLASRTAGQLRDAGLGARIVGRGALWALRDADFQTITRQRALRGPTELTEPLRRTAEALLDEALVGSDAPFRGRRIRLLGLRVAGLGPLARQLELPYVA